MKTIKNITRSILHSVLPESVVDKIHIFRAQDKADPEMELLEYMSEGGGFVDIGANIGMYSYKAKDFFSYIYAFEPHPDLARRLRQLAWAKVTVFETALSNKKGELILYIPEQNDREIDTRCSLEKDANIGFSQKEKKVSVLSLDDMTFERDDIDVLKIDVEGHEQTVLQGAEKLIKRCKPTLVIEIEERHHKGQTRNIFKYIKDMGYQGLFIYENSLLSISEFSIDIHQREENAKSLREDKKLEQYINNFIFVGRQSVLQRLLEQQKYPSQSNLMQS